MIPLLNIMNQEVLGDIELILYTSDELTHKFRIGSYQFRIPDLDIKLSRIGAFAYIHDVLRKAGVKDLTELPSGWKMNVP